MLISGCQPALSQRPADTFTALVVVENDEIVIILTVSEIYVFRVSSAISARFRMSVFDKMAWELFF